jgi:hypothetical protein
VLLTPVLNLSADFPKAVLLEPGVLLASAKNPKAVLSTPVVLLKSALDPPAVFRPASLTSLFGGPAKLGAAPNIKPRIPQIMEVPGTLFVIELSF